MGVVVDTESENKVKPEIQFECRNPSLVLDQKSEVPRSH